MNCEQFWNDIHNSFVKGLLNSQKQLEAQSNSTWGRIKKQYYQGEVDGTIQMKANWENNKAAFMTECEISKSTVSLLKYMYVQSK